MVLALKMTTVDAVVVVWRLGVVGLVVMGAVIRLVVIGMVAVSELALAGLTGTPICTPG